MITSQGRGGARARLPLGKAPRSHPVVPDGHCRRRRKVRISRGRRVTVELQLNSNGAGGGRGGAAGVGDRRLDGGWLDGCVASVVFVVAVVCYGPVG